MPGRTGQAHTVDAIVAVTASGRGQQVRILTSDPDGLRALTAKMDGVSVVAV